MPKSAEERAVSGGRARSSSVVSPEIVRAWTARANELEAFAATLLKRARRKPTAKTPSNGTQMSADLSAALKALDAADKIWLRIARVAPAPGGKGDERTSLDAYRAKKRRREA